MTKNPHKVDWQNKMDYEFLVGRENWERLHPAIQQRFSLDTDQPVTYRGVMNQVYLSLIGKLLAQLCRLIGTPLALYSGKDVPTEVKVYADEKLAGMTWDRFYFYPDKAVNRVKSTKCIQNNIGLVEMVGYGFGMNLNVYQKERAIYFESTRFFWQLGKFKFFIPDILSPGKTIVSQKALGDNKFQFRLDVTHCLFGKIFKQIGIFEEVNP